MAEPPNPLDFIEGVNTMADAMDAMKHAMEERGWSSLMSEQIGATFGTVLMGMINTPPPKGKR